MTGERSSTNRPAAITPAFIIGGILTLLMAAGIFVHATLLFLTCNFSDSDTPDARCSNGEWNPSHEVSIAQVLGVAAIVMFILAIALRPKKELVFLPTVQLPPPPPSAISTCPNCQKPIGLGTAYCAHCGTKLITPDLSGEGLTSTDS